MKKIAYAIVPVLALAGGAAMAIDTPPQTLSFGTQGSTSVISVGGTAVTRTLSLKTFGQVVQDEAITAPAGFQLVLNSIHYTFEVQLDSDGVLTNVTSDPAALALGTLNVVLTNDWQTVYKDSAFSDATKTWESSGTDVVLVDSGGYNILPLPSAPLNVWDPAQQTSGPNADSYDAVNLGLTSGDWFNLGTFDVITSLRASTSLAGELISGTGTYNVTFSTGTWGAVSLYYDYTFSANSVPVPAPLALIGLGLGFLGLRRRFAR
jgi:hypothetical protein